MEQGRRFLPMTGWTKGGSAMPESPQVSHGAAGPRRAPQPEEIRSCHRGDVAVASCPLCPLCPARVTETQQSLTCPRARVEPALHRDTQLQPQQ